MVLITVVGFLLVPALSFALSCIRVCVVWDGGGDRGQGGHCGGHAVCITVCITSLTVHNDLLLPALRGGGRRQLAAGWCGDPSFRGSSPTTCCHLQHTSPHPHPHSMWNEHFPPPPPLHTHLLGYACHLLLACSKQYLLTHNTLPVYWWLCPGML